MNGLRCQDPPTVGSIHCLQISPYEALQGEEAGGGGGWACSLRNGSFQSCCMPQFQNESWCTTIQM